MTESPNPNSTPIDEPDPLRAVTPEEFGRELTLLRERAGLTIRQAASKADIPVSTAGDYFVGRHLPPQSQAEALRKLVRCCGIDAPEQVEVWVRSLGRVRRSPGRRPASSPAPYKGLAAFEAEDTEWFFGRAELAERLTGLVMAPPSGLLITVTGASGSGKSSLLRAGLIAELRRGPGGDQSQPPVVLLTPGAAPMSALPAQLAITAQPTCGSAHDHPVVVVVDQFEEVFTTCPDESERREFIRALAELADLHCVVIGLRADFYGHALRYPQLTLSLQHRQVVVGPMTQAELLETITEPARRAKLSLEPGLAHLLLHDLAPPGTLDDPRAVGHDAGALPLLSHALRATWERRQGSRLTVAGYQASGGIRHAVARTAEAAYAALAESDRERTRRLFLDLVHVSQDGPLARARVPVGELAGSTAVGGTADGPSGGMLARFVEERLITVDENAGQIAHEALLTAWPRLRDWIAADRDRLKVRHRIAAAAIEWQQADREEAVLLRGAPLAAAVEWATDPVNPVSLSPLGRDFLDASVAHARAREAAEQRHAFLRRLAVVLAALVLVAGGLTSYAFSQRHSATVASDEADSAAVALEAGPVRGQDPALAAQLSLAAYRISPTEGALGSLLESAAFPMDAEFRDSPGLVQSVALAPDRRVLAVAAADGTLRLWNVAVPGRPLPIGSPVLRAGHQLYATAFSPDGRLLAAAGAGDVIWLFDVADPQKPVQLGPALRGPRDTVYSLAFTPDGKILVAGSADKTVRLWNVTDPAHPARLGRPLTGPTDYVEAVAVSPDGQLLAAASADKTVRLWKITDPARPTRVGPALTGPAGAMDAVAFSPDGRTLAAGSRDHSVWLWNITNPAHAAPALKRLTTATDWVNAVAFSPDGRILAAASSDNTVRIWNAADGALLGTLPGPQPITSLAWDTDHTLMAGEADGVVRAWVVPSPVLLNAGTVSQVTYSPDGKLLAVAADSLRLWNPVTRTLVADVTAPHAFVDSVAWAPDGQLLAAAYDDGKVRLWRIGLGRLTQVGPAMTATAKNGVESIAFRPDGRVLVSTGDDGTVRLWNVANPARPRPLVVFPIPGTIVFSAAFSPNGRFLATGSTDNLTRLWNVSDPARPRLLESLAGPTSYVISVAFSPDGRILAVGSADKTTRLWNVTDPAQPRRLGSPLTGPDGYVYSVAFSPDGGRLAIGSTDGTIWLWNVSNPVAPTLVTHLTSALSPTGHIFSVAFGPGGRTLASGSSDGSVRLWELRPGTAAAMLCATIGQPLTRDQWASYIPGRPYDPPCARSRMQS